MKPKQLGLASAALVMSFCAQIGSARADITYDVSFNVLTGQIPVTGSITTDGHIGVLTAGDIQDFDLHLNLNGIAFDLLGPGHGATQNAATTLVGTAVAATSTDLTFDYGTTNSELLFHNPVSGSPLNSLCFHTMAATPVGCQGRGAALAITLDGGGNAASFQSGVFEIGTAAAVPGSIVGAGLPGLILAGATAGRSARCERIVPPRRLTSRAALIRRRRKRNRGRSSVSRNAAS